MVQTQDKSAFLRSEHERLLKSGQIFWSSWSDDIDRFIADLWDMVPGWIAGRYLAPKEKALGICPDNVEWHFRSHRLPYTAKSPAPKAKKPAARKASKRTMSSYAKMKKLAETAKLERRKKVAEEFQRWEQVRKAA